MNREKILVKGKVRALTPLLIGSGTSENTDMDVIRDKDGKPYIPATSLVGVLRSETLFIRENEESGYRAFWGERDSGQSCICCSDMELEDGTGAEPVIRNGIRIDTTTGMVRDKGKYDFETIPSGSVFSFEMEIEGTYGNSAFCRKMAGTILSLLEQGVSIGAKISSGLGRIKLIEKAACIYDLAKKEDVVAWLNNGDMPREDSAKLLGETLLTGKKDVFRISVDLEIKNSLLVRSYSSDPSSADAIHIKEAGRNILPGTSIKGALRARAERIVNTVFTDRAQANEFMDALFGFVDEENYREGKNSPLASSFIVEEIPVEEVLDSEVQHRIKIDRFTGGTIEGALMESVPLFTREGATNLKNFSITIKNALDSQKGLALLLLKDLWTSDLPIGGEKSIGRGVLMGKSVRIYDGDKEISFTDPEGLKQEDLDYLQYLVESFAGNLDSAEIKKRITKDGRK